MGTPAAVSMTPGATPGGTVAMNMQTPTPGHLISMTPEQMQAYRWEKEIDDRNRPLTDDELDALMPFEGYKVNQNLQNNNQLELFLIHKKCNLESYYGN